MCYGGMGVGGSVMVLGGIKSPRDMVLTHLDPFCSPYYNIELMEIHVAGKALKFYPKVFDEKHGTVLDGGTTYAYSPKDAFIAFKDAVMVGSFLPGHQQEHKPKKQRIKSVSSPIVPIIVNSVIGEEMKGYSGLKPFMMTTSFHGDNSNSLSHLLNQNFKNSTFGSSSLVAEEEYSKALANQTVKFLVDHDSTVSLCDSCTRMVFFRLGDI